MGGTKWDVRVISIRLVTTAPKFMNVRDAVSSGTQMKMVLMRVTMRMVMEFSVMIVWRTND
jgi:hypothetical protein